MFAVLAYATVDGIYDIVLDYLPAVTICNLNRVNCHNAFQAMFDIKTTIDNSSLGNTELAMMELTLIQLTELVSSNVTNCMFPNSNNDEETKENGRDNSEGSNVTSDSSKTNNKTNEKSSENQSGRKAKREAENPPLIRVKRKGPHSKHEGDSKGPDEETKSVDFDSDARFVKRMMDIPPKYRFNNYFKPKCKIY